MDYDELTHFCVDGDVLSLIGSFPLGKGLLSSHGILDDLDDWFTAGWCYSPERSISALSKSGFNRKLRLRSLSMTGFKADMSLCSLARSRTPAVPVNRNPCICAMVLANLSSRTRRAEGCSAPIARTSAFSAAQVYNQIQILWQAASQYMNPWIFF